MTAVRSPGRPRDSGIDAAILLATWELLNDVGYAALTMTAVAEAAGVQKPALYRRWPTKTLLVVDVMAAHLPPQVYRDLGSLRADLADQIAQLAATWRSPAVRRSFSPLLSELMDDHEALQAFGERVSQPRTAAIHDLVTVAAKRGELRPDAPVGLVSALLEGPLMHRALLGGAPGLEEDLREVLLVSCLALLTHS